MNNHGYQTIDLKQVDMFRFRVKQPFCFQYTFWKPSHFLTGLETHEKGVNWRTFRFGKALCGVRAEMDETEVVATIFGDENYNEDVARRVRFRVSQGYGLDEDLTPFIKCAQKHRAMKPCLEKLSGMRESCPDSLFELAIIGLVLQNTTIERTIAMFSWLLNSFGKIVSFDGKILRAFYSPQDLIDLDEETIRQEGRFGYRSKYVPAFVEFFSKIDDEELRQSSHETIMIELRKIKGVGPYTASIISGAALRDIKTVNIDVWNRKIFAKKLLNKEDESPVVLQKYFDNHFGKFSNLAALYMTEYEFVIGKQHLPAIQGIFPCSKDETHKKDTPYAIGKMLNTVRALLFKKQYDEVVSPIIRSALSCPSKCFSLENNKFLRPCMELPLRKLVTTRTPKIFEIGPCFRDEREDSTHRNEFYMLELYSMNGTLCEMRGLAEEIIFKTLPNIKKPAQMISIRESIKDDLKIDIALSTTEELVHEIQRKSPGKYPSFYDNKKRKDYEIINEYISEEIEKKDAVEVGVLYFLTDYPVCTIAIAERISTNPPEHVIQRFECFINGVEIANAFVDCMDGKDLKKRIEENFEEISKEDKELLSLTKIGKIAPTAGLGLGINRLCMLK